MLRAEIDPFMLPEESEGRRAPNSGAARGAKPSSVGNISININGAANQQATAKAVMQAIVDVQKYGANAGMLAAIP